MKISKLGAIALLSVCIALPVTQIKCQQQKPSPLEQAVFDGKLDQVKHLLDSGANIKAGKIPILFFAVLSSDPALVKLLVERGADVNAVSSYDSQSFLKREQEMLKALAVGPEEKALFDDPKEFQEFKKKRNKKRKAVKKIIQYLKSKGAK